MRRASARLIFVGFCLLLAGCASAETGTSLTAGPSATVSAPPTDPPTPVPTDPPTPSPSPAPTASPTPDECRPTHQDRYIYRPSRLIVLADCLRVSGTVKAVLPQADGDLHILLALDPPYLDLLRPANKTDPDAGGALVVEPICVGPRTEADAIAICAKNPNPMSGPFPDIDERVWMEGRYVLDRDHGRWAELHPLYRWWPYELTYTVETFALPAGSGPHDVAPARDGGVWYTAQRSGKVGWLDPAIGNVREVPLGAGSSPHGVIVGPDGAPWITDSGLNAIVRVEPGKTDVTAYPLPASAPAVNLNTAAFDRDGTLWFTGQAGFYGRLDPATGEIQVFEAPRGRGPYGITATPAGEIYYSSLAGSYLGAVDRATGDVRVIDPPTADAGLRRCWSDSRGRIWVSEWNAGQVGVYDPADGSWREWRLPGDAPMAYAVFVDETDAVWLSDFAANAIVRFDPRTESFTSFPAESQPAEVRQLAGRPGEVWGAESAADRLVVIRWSAGA